MKVCIFTSSKGTSLSKVSEDIKKVITSSDKMISVTILNSPALSVDILESCDSSIIVMPFDLTWCIPYFFIGYEFKSRKKKTVFYATTEGRVPKEMVRNWILRDLTFVANSEYVKGKLDEVNAKVIDVIPHGIDFKFIKSVKEWGKEVRDYLGVGDKTVVGYVAQGHERKCHDLFSQVVKIVKSRDPSIEFVILTDKKGSKNYSDTDAIVVEEFGILSEEQYYGYMYAIDVYAHGSCSEGFGLPVLEALACGKLVVHPDYKPLTEITTPEVSVRVKPSEILLAKIGGAGIIYELKRYRPERFAEAVLTAVSMLRNSGNEIAVKSVSRAMKYDIYKLYTRFLPLITDSQV